MYRSKASVQPFSAKVYNHSKQSSSAAIKPEFCCHNLTDIKNWSDLRRLKNAQPRSVKREASKNMSKDEVASRLDVMMHLYQAGKSGVEVFELKREQEELQNMLLWKARNGYDVAGIGAEMEEMVTEMEGIAKMFSKNRQAANERIKQLNKGMKEKGKAVTSDLIIAWDDMEGSLA